jgi:hypothetical protein
MQDGPSPSGVIHVISAEWISITVVRISKDIMNEVSGLYDHFCPESFLNSGKYFFCPAGFRGSSIGHSGTQLSNP